MAVGVPQHAVLELREAEHEVAELVAHALVELEARGAACRTVTARYSNYVVWGPYGGIAGPLSSCRCRRWSSETIAIYPKERVPPPIFTAQQMFSQPDHLFCRKEKVQQQQSLSGFRRRR